MRGALDFGRERGVVERLDRVGLRWIEHPHQARAQTRQRHQSERTARRMEFGRGVMMRAGMRQAGGDRHLLVLPFVDRDAGGGAAQRAAAVGGDHQRRAQLKPAPERHRDAVVARCDAAHLVLDHAQRGQRGGALLQRRDQMEILDIVAEDIEVDFVRLEFHFRRAPQPPGVVDDAHHPHRRCLRRAERPDAERLQGGDRAREQGGGAVVGAGGALSHQHGRKTRASQRDRRSQPGRDRRLPRLPKADRPICPASKRLILLNGNGISTRRAGAETAA